MLGNTILKISRPNTILFNLTINVSKFQNQNPNLVFEKKFMKLL
jgi:hypothetical protein